MSKDGLPEDTRLCEKTSKQNKELSSRAQTTSSEGPGCSKPD